MHGLKLTFKKRQIVLKLAATRTNTNILYVPICTYKSIHALSKGCKGLIAIQEGMKSAINEIKEAVMKLYVAL